MRISFLQWKVWGKNYAFLCTFYFCPLLCSLNVSGYPKSFFPILCISNEAPSPPALFPLPSKLRADGDMGQQWAKIWMWRHVGLHQYTTFHDGFHGMGEASREVKEGARGSKNRRKVSDPTSKNCWFTSIFISWTLPPHHQTFHCLPPICFMVIRGGKKKCMEFF